MPVAHDDPNDVAACPSAKAQAVRDIRAINPDVLFVTNYAFSGPDYEPNWRQSTVDQLARVQDSVGKIVILGSTPMTPNPLSCYTPRSVPADCAGSPPAGWESMARIQYDIAQAVGGVYIDSGAWFCFEDFCPAFVGKTPVRIDEAHVNQAYGEKITPVIEETLRTAGVLRPTRPAGNSS
jgi:hypothetical protein